MNKFLSIMFAAMLLTVAFLPAAASPPEPAYYSVTQNGSCWLPNANLKPTNVLGAKQTFDWVAPLHLEAVCQGQLLRAAAAGCGKHGNGEAVGPLASPHRGCADPDANADGYPAGRNRCQ